MQTPKKRNSSSEVPQKISPRATSSEATPKVCSRTISAEASQKASPRVVRQLKTSGLDSDSASPSKLSNKTTKERSPKVTARKSPRSPVSEKKHPSRAAELESQICQLRNDLKDVKDKLCISEAGKTQAQQDALESKEQLIVFSAKFEESKKQFLDLTADKTPVIEVQRTSELQDQALQSELEALQKQHSVESAALTSALNEIKGLKVQLEMVAESGATHGKHTELAQTELHTLKENLTETLLLVENMKNQLKDCKESEAQARAFVGETLMQLETAKKTVEMLRADGIRAMEAYNSISAELEQSKAHVKLLEDLVHTLQVDSNNDYQNSYDQKIKSEMKENEENMNLIKSEIVTLKSEAVQLRSALEAAEIRYNKEQTESKVQLRSAGELVEEVKSAASQREAELEAELQRSKVEVEELKANLMDKETELQGICEENENLNRKLENKLLCQKDNELEKELQKSKEDIENMKANLMDKETELQNILEENELLKLENKRKETNRGIVNDEVVAELESAKAAEREALMKLGYMKEEIDKSNRRASRVTEQLDAAQVANVEMEAELRRLKVQSDQWRKAAEAAAAMLSAPNNGKLMGRTGSMDSNYSPGTRNVHSPYSEDMHDNVLKKKNANMLKRIGILRKKSQK